jgi:hypothetical protein
VQRLFQQVALDRNVPNRANGQDPNGCGTQDKSLHPITRLRDKSPSGVLIDLLDNSPSTTTASDDDFFIVIIISIVVIGAVVEIVVIVVLVVFGC